MTHSIAMKRAAFRLSQVIILTLLLTACGAEGLAIGNIVQEAGRVSFKLANDSGRSGDVVFWIEQNDLTSCERITVVSARQSYTINMTYGALRTGTFYVRFAWATDMRERAVVAERIE